jgi:hypothetical protein
VLSIGVAVQRRQRQQRQPARLHLQYPCSDAVWFYLWLPALSLHLLLRLM